MLSDYIMEETLLMAPALAAYELVQFILVLGAPDILTFVKFYAIRTSMIFTYRTYLEPQLKNFAYTKKKFITWVTKKIPFLKKIFGQ